MCENLREFPGCKGFKHIKGFVISAPPVAGMKTKLNYDKTCEVTAGYGHVNGVRSPPVRYQLAIRVRSPYSSSTSVSNRLEILRQQYDPI